MELCKNWSRRWDEHVQPTLWLHPTTPDPRLPGKATLFLLLFGRDCRTQMDAFLPSPDDEGMDGLHNFFADKSKNLRQVKKVCKDLQHRHEQRRLRREHHNAGIRRTSIKTRVKQGDLVAIYVQVYQNRGNNHSSLVKPTYEEHLRVVALTGIERGTQFHPFAFYFIV